MPNQLIHETSPYLLQHAENPVDWYPWGPEALKRARDEDKPIFLSIGYAACHWCHVMAHESFEDPETARLLNEHFISIKVDREERPDLDGIYMNAVVAMTGQGGWPMSLFLTPEGQPFYGGTYFPSTRRYGMPSFKEVLAAVVEAWAKDKEEIRRTGKEIVAHLEEATSLPPQPGGIRPGIDEQALKSLLDSYDWQMGGWGHAPRFPQPMAIEFLLMQATRGRDKALDAARHALTVMSRGGLYDVVGGGFHRYSTDDQWLVPHFEKMLYDNAQLALAYLHASLLIDDPAFAYVCTGTLDFILREMTGPQGGFFSSLDADSEGEEGKYYLWSREEIDAALTDPDQRTLFYQVYPVTEEGNFEGRNILQHKNDLAATAAQLNLTEEELIQRLGEIHRALYQARKKRIRPATDDKVLVGWNALALRAFAQAARYLQRPDYLAAARENANFLMIELYPEERLKRAWREGQARHNALLEDYAALILALLDLYESDPDLRWYQAAVELAEDMQANFRDPQGGFYDTRDDHGELITRPKEMQDNAVPSGNALAAGALLRLAAFDERADWLAQAEGMIASVQDLITRYPTSFGFWLQDLDFAAGPLQQVAIIGRADDKELQEMIDQVWSAYRPRTVTAVSYGKGGPESPGLLQDRGRLHDRATAYVCENFTCNLPVTDLEGLKKQLAE